MKLTKDEKAILAFVMNHYSDYLAGDDRPDHGMARLKAGREWNSEKKKIAYKLAGRLMR